MSNVAKDIYEPIDYLNNNFEYAEHLQRNIIARATNGDWDSYNYKEIRGLFLQDNDLKKLLPDYIRTCRDIEQFWQYIKTEFSGTGSYAARKKFIYDTFQGLLGYLEEKELIKNGSSIIKLAKVEEVLTIDQQLNKLIEEAKKRFENPKDKKVALDLLWDAYERLKTYFSKNKRLSVEELAKLVSTDFDYDFIHGEFLLLSDIGNKYNIRHHEKDKKIITQEKHVEYLFFRMLTLLNLCIANIHEIEE